MKKKLMAMLGCILGLITLSSCSLLGGLGGGGNGSENNSSVEENVSLTVTAPKGEAYPYILSAQEYLQAGAGANIREYLLTVDNPTKAIKIKWDCNAEAASYQVEYATKADYSDAIVEECSGDKQEIELYNLYKAAKYYVRVTAQNEGGMSLTTAETTFQTTALGPRVMKIDDIHNVRDMGGYETLDGKTTVQGILYRGGTLRPADVYKSNLTEDGARYMSEVMGIKTEIDFRSQEETGGLTESPIPNATLQYATLSGYSDAFNYTLGYKQAFTLLADKDNYPIYYHCTGGADRTGTVSFLLNALLGVPETVCIQDYEFTSYSIFGERNTQGGVYGNIYFRSFRETLETYEGDTLQEKVESYLLSIGITKTQIANIKAIMYGEEVVDKVEDEEKEEVTAVLTVTAPTGEVFPYINAAKNYLQAPAGTNVNNYAVSTENAYQAVQIEWDCNAENAVKYQVEYATQADYSDAITEETAEKSIGVYNLYKGTKYYVRVTAYDADGKVILTDESTFETTSLGPRVMKVDDIHNVRDLGGYETTDGKTTVQGLIYRGGTLRPADIYDSYLTESGARYMSEVMGVKTEIDFRRESEAGNLTESLIPNANLVYATLGGYSDAYSSTQSYKKVFSTLADKENYPVYYHCTGGADRTGTVSFLLNALLGVPEAVCIQDYEFTTFSVYGERNSQTGVYSTYFIPFRETLETYEGDTLQEKVESYLLSIGVTAEEIYNIKAIMHGEETLSYAAPQPKYAQDIDGKFTVTVSAENAVTALYIAETQVAYTQTEKILTVKAADMPRLANGAVNGKVVLEGGQELIFTFTCEAIDCVELDEYMAFNENGVLTLTADNPLVTGTKAVGYGQTVCIRMQSTLVGENGGITVMVGSYGFQLRGGEFRAMQLSDGGTITETARNTGLGGEVHTFDEGEALLFLTVDFVDGKPVMYIKVLSSGIWLERTYTYAGSISGEIASENAKVTFSIKAPDCSGLNVYTSAAWKNR